MITYYFKPSLDQKRQVTSSLIPGSLGVGTQTTKEELKQVAKATKLHLSDLLDMFDEQEIPRLERHDTSLVVFLRSPMPGETNFRLELLTVIISSQCIYLLSPTRNRLVKKILKKASLTTTSDQTQVIISLLTAITQEYTRKIKTLSQHVSVQQRQIDNPQDKDIAKLIHIERILNDYISALVPMQTMYQNLLRGKHLTLQGANEDIFEDVLIAINQCVDVCKVTIKNIISLRDSVQIMFTNKLNQTMKLLTSATVLLTIPTIISSIYGMNVPLPLANHSAAFTLIVIAIFVTLGITARIFFRKNWF